MRVTHPSTRSSSRKAVKNDMCTQFNPVVLILICWLSLCNCTNDIQNRGFITRNSIGALDLCCKVAYWIVGEVKLFRIIARELEKDWLIMTEIDSTCESLYNTRRLVSTTLAFIVCLRSCCVRHPSARLCNLLIWSVLLSLLHLIPCCFCVQGNNNLGVVRRIAVVQSGQLHFYCPITLEPPPLHNDKSMRLYGVNLHHISSLHFLRKSSFLTHLDPLWSLQKNDLEHHIPFLLRDESMGREPTPQVNKPIHVQPQLKINFVLLLGWQQSLQKWLSILLLLRDDTKTGGLKEVQGNGTLQDPDCTEPFNTNQSGVSGYPLWIMGSKRAQ